MLKVVVMNEAEKLMQFFSVIAMAVRKTRRMKIILSLRKVVMVILLIFSTSPSYCEIVKCIGPDGDILYGDKPCPTGYKLDESFANENSVYEEGTEATFPSFAPKTKVLQYAGDVLEENSAGEQPPDANVAEKVDPSTYYDENGDFTMTFEPNAKFRPKYRGNTSPKRMYRSDYYRPLTPCGPSQRTYYPQSDPVHDAKVRRIRRDMKDLEGRIRRFKAR